MEKCQREKKETLLIIEIIKLIVNIYVYITKMSALEL